MSYVKDNSKAKCIHKYKYDHTHLYRVNIFAIVGLFDGNWGRREIETEQYQNTLHLYKKMA
jgi:hypothetical protein